MARGVQSARLHQGDDRDGGGEPGVCRDAEEGNCLKKGLIITIDGPGGAGKSTVSRRLAQAIGYRFLDTGAMYRGVAYAYAHSKPDDLETFLAHVRLAFSFDGAATVSLDGEDISGQIRTPEITSLASSLSQDVRVRVYCTAIQREIGKSGRVVVEGRDTGSVVFPDADVKFYLDADIGERARRRYLELKAANQETDIRTVEEEIAQRDSNDSRRAIAPLIRPQGALAIDTTGKTVDDVVNLMRKYVKKAEQ